MKTLIKNGTIVTASDTIKADVLIEGEQVALIGRDLPADGANVIDASGKLLLPGGIDVHTHLELPFGGTVSSDDFFTGHKAAAFGGTTMHIDFVIQPIGGTLKQGIDAWHAKARDKAVIDYGFTEAKTPQGHIGVQVWINNGMYEGDGDNGVDAEEGQAPKKSKRTYKR